MDVKPKLLHATVIKKTVNKGPKPDHMPDAFWEALVSGKLDGKECGTNDMGIGAHFKIIGIDSPVNPRCFKTEGTPHDLTLNRLVGGCNSIRAFEIEGAEKSEDYDIIPAHKLISVPRDFNEAAEFILSNYLNKTLRVVARTAANVTRYGGRHYLFTIDD